MLRTADGTYLCAAIAKFPMKDMMDQHWEIYEHLKKHADHSTGACMFLHTKGFGGELGAFVKWVRAEKRASL